MDVYMPIMDGITTTEKVRETYADTRVLVLTSSTEDDQVIRALKASADGFLLKDADRREVISGISDVARGIKHLSHEVAGMLANVNTWQKFGISPPLPSANWRSRGGWDEG